MHEYWRLMPTFSENLFCNLKLNTMIKRAYTLLLLISFFFFSTLNAISAVVCGQLVGGTKFELKSSTSAKNLENIKTYGSDTFSASSYTLSSGSISIAGNQNKEGVFVHTLSGLPTTDYDYEIAVTYSSSGDTEFRFKWNTHGNQEVQIDNNKKSGTETFTIKSKGGSLSWSIQECGNQKANIVITSITVTGCIEQKIVSENNNVLCKGEENTFRAIGLGETGITWKLNGTTISGVTGSTYTASFLEGGKISASSSLGSTDDFEFKAVLCCATSADRVVLALETFKTPNTNATCKVEELHRNVSTAYHYTSNKAQIHEDQYAIVKNTDGAWEGWYKDNGAKIVYGNTQNNKDITDAILTQHNQSGAKGKDYDGFIVANCNINKYVKGNPTASKSAIIFEYNVYGICPNVYHDFSSFISNVDATAGHAEINVLFEVVEIDNNGNEINPNTPLFTRETGYKACGDQSWKEYGGSFINGNNTNVKLKLYNNNQTAKPETNSTKIVGNDVAVDDITFSRCVPRINVHFDKTLTQFAKSDVCNNVDTEITLYIGHYDYIINELLPGGYYIVEQREANANGTWGTWKPVMSAPKQLTTNSYEEVKVTVKANQGETQYRAIVAPTAADVETVRANNNATLQDCSIYNITKENTYAKLTYACSEPQSEDPSVKIYSECPDPSAPTLDLNTLITSVKLVDGPTHTITKPADIAQYGTITFYDANGTPVPNNGVISIPTTLAPTDPSFTKDYIAKFTQKKAADGTEYSASKGTKVQVIVSTQVPITLEIKGEVYGPQNPYSVCINETVKLDALHTLKSGESVKWTATTATGTTTLPDNTTSISVTPQESTTYTVEILNNTCRTPNSVLVNVTSPVKPLIASDKDEVCANNSINIKDSNTDTAEEYQWYFKPENKDWGKLEGYNNKNLENYIPQETGTYKVTTKVAECTSESDPVKVVVGPAINFTVTPSQKICEGGSTYLKISGHPAGSNVQWYKGDILTGEKIGEGEAEVNVTPEATTIYTASVEKICTASKETQVIVGGKIHPQISADEDICFGQQSQLIATGGDSYTWTPAADMNNAGIANPIAKPSETTTYNVQIKTDVCTKDTSIVVTVHELPIIESIVVEGEKKDRYAVPTVKGGETPYYYSLNGEDFSEVPEEILSNVPIGWNLLYVKDHYDCESTKEFYVEPVPIIPAKFFTPNEDGKNEVWTIKDLDAYSSYIVEIFDRHGKRLYIKKVGSFNGEEVTKAGSEIFEWEGIYNGHPLPSDDYWYLITVEDIRKQYTGHFTLKR